MHTAPIVSIVIPTYDRADLLPQAIASCLDGFNSGDIEVIVVPNGPDNSWKQSLAVFNDNPMVKIFPIDVADANTARNHGMAHATGRYLRFLDDDDILLAAGTAEQYTLMDKTGADICSGPVVLINDDGEQFDLLEPSTTKDFVSALLAREMATIPVAHVFRRAYVHELEWLPQQPFLQDQLWMHIVARHAEPNWVKTETVVGKWRHHGGYRISIHDIKSVHTALTSTSKILIATISELDSRQQMTPERTAIASTTLWNLSHECFYLKPWYWHSVAKTAISLDSKIRPEKGLSSSSIGKWLNPLMLEWLMVPGRWLEAFVKWLFRKIIK